jgi:nucleotide-binding universal stress UspA family protein
VELAKPFEAEINLLHIRSGKLDESMEYSELEGFKNRVVEETGYPHIRFTLIDHDDAYTGLNAYVEETKPDLLVLSMRNRNFVQKVFGRSITKRMAHHGHTPLYVLHTEA